MSAPPEGADEYTTMRAIEAVVARKRAGEDVGDVGWIVERLGDVDEWVVSTAAEACGPLGLVEAGPRLVALLASGPDTPPEHFDSGMQAYAWASVEIEGMEVRLAAARALGQLGLAGQGEARVALEAAADNQAEHPSVRRAAREELASARTGGAELKR